MNDSGKLISKIIGKTMFKYKMINEGDRILIAVSGGKDSMTLLHDFAKRIKSFPIKFEFEAIHIQTDFCTCCQKSKLEDQFIKLEIKYHIVDVGVLKRLKKDQKMNCYWCSSQRRMELIKFARDNNFNKIALGHHLDDIIETLFMNICYKGQISGMLPILALDKYPITIIRPLAQVKEIQIIKYAHETNLDRLVCKCPYGTNSKRKEIRKSLELFTKGDDSIKYNIFKSMENVHFRYLIENSSKQITPALDI